MSIWQGILSLFTGKTVEKAVDMADDAIFTQQEKAKEDVKFTTETLANSSVDFFNRLIRPGITLYYLGGFSGWWKLPEVSQIDPVHFQIFIIIITFWFGGRVLLKDLPSAIGAILRMRKNK